MPDAGVYRAKKTGGFQIVLVVGLLTLLTGFIGSGLVQLDMSKLEGIVVVPSHDVLATVGLVFISYVGVTNVASVAEEVKDPERNLPRGVFLALGTALIVYVLGLIVLVGVVGADRLASDPSRNGLPELTPVATTAAVEQLYEVGLERRSVITQVHKRDAARVERNEHVPGWAPLCDVAVGVAGCQQHLRFHSFRCRGGEAGERFFNHASTSLSFLIPR